MNKRKLSTAVCGAIIGLFVMGTSVYAEQTHKVNPGDTLWGISKQYNTSVSALKQWNNLATNMIYVGQELTVTDDEKGGDNEPSQPSPSFSTYTVEYGDSLWEISLQHGISVTELKELNHLKGDIIYIGQKLIITKGKNPVPDAAPIMDEPVQPDQMSAKTYTVQFGDTLWGIATMNGMSVFELQKLNHLSTHLIFVGQKLVIEEGADPTFPVEFKVSALIQEAKKLLGSPYQWGGTSPSGFDCSGYLNYVFNQVGVDLPRTVAGIFVSNQLEEVSDDKRKVGDLVFFETYKPGPSHAGIYLGNDQFIHTGSTNGVEISSMTSNYWGPRYLETKRLR